MIIINKKKAWKKKFVFQFFISNQRNPHQKAKKGKNRHPRVWLKFCQTAEHNQHNKLRQSLKNNE
jgi:hypothetical protein